LYATEKLKVFIFINFAGLRKQVLQFYKAIQSLVHLLGYGQ